MIDEYPLIIEFWTYTKVGFCKEYLLLHISTEQNHSFVIKNNNFCASLGFEPS